MAEAANDVQQEFWQPPTPVNVTGEVVVAEGAPVLAEVCRRCGTEFMIGARFCHTCGVRRPEADSPGKADAAVMAHLWAEKMAWVRTSFSRVSWPKVSFPDWLRYLHFHEIKRWIGLPTASFIAFLIGLGCVLWAIGITLVYRASNFVEFQAIQMWRVELLLAATASFVAGILLKKPDQD